MNAFVNKFEHSLKISEFNKLGASQLLGLRGDSKTAAMREFAERQGERREGRPARNFRQEIYLKANPPASEFNQIRVSQSA
ncbi:hypothetical protein KJ633_02470 [bacterium]|nr:hypothetical protein [bacterium]MBU4134295.1 hypothetical protein [bacterium]